MITRRTFLAGLATLGAGGLGGYAYARHIEPRWLVVSQTRVPLPHLEAGRPIRLLHLSDFHLSSHVPLPFIDEAITRGLDTDPDLICVTGDFVTGRIREYDAYRAVLAKLSAAAPTFACLGNHDGGAWSKYRGGYPDTQEIRAFVKAADITCLTNRTVPVEVDGRKLTVTGVGDLWAHELQPGQAFPAAHTQTSTPGIVLCHNPDSKTELASYPWDLMLCGHTHGGQLHLPLVGAPFAPVRDKRYVEGLNEWEGRWIYTTRGVGNVGGLRFNCRPEISLLELEAKV